MPKRKSLSPSFNAPDNPTEPELDPREQIIKNRRMISSLFQFWRACERASCRRARDCAGDPVKCFNTFWPYVPEETKDALRVRVAEAAAAAAQR